MLKLLGFLDILASVLLFFASEQKIILLIIAIYLFLKGIFFMLFSFSLTSLTDIAIAIACVLFLAIEMPEIILAIAAIFLFQKGILSLL